MNLDNTAQTHLPPETLLYGGVYAIGRVLEQDDSGITYEGTDINLRRPVVIQEFFPSGYTRMGSYVLRDFASSTALEQFLAEARALAHLSVPNSVKVLAVFEENNTAYRVTAQPEDKTLEPEAEEAAPLPETEVVLSLEQLPLLQTVVVPATVFPPQDIQPAVAVEIQVATAPEPPPVEISPLFPPPVPPSDWLPIPAKTRRCPRCGSVSPKTAAHCVACNTSLTPNSPPETKGKLRTVHYVVLMILVFFLVLMALYLPGASPDA